MSAVVGALRTGPDGPLHVRTVGRVLAGDELKSGTLSSAIQKERKGKLLAMTAIPLLHADGLHRVAADGAVLLDGVSLDVSAGERVGIEGPTGAGKSVLLRALALLDPLDGGTVRHRGEPVADHAVPRFRSRVAYLHQSPALIEGTVEENLRAPFGLALHRHRTYDRDRAVELLDALGRGPDLLTKDRGDLSGGERQITALVRLLQLEPEVLLLDEPTAALDPGSTDRMERLLAHWIEQRSDRAAVWVTHDRQQAARVATRRMTVAGGRLGPPSGTGTGGR